ncbi:hypothetical protein TSUD_367930 [Trifolium subterraneum]|uniref:Uncharacterized protein n=1 Tax=Trifolium subterraneum TaxID=3900 RepID=A0A2Z6LIB9_TRISU|nr:hypothetical protein TSUD_367930 [Trifolium subterraneum]
MRKQLYWWWNKWARYFISYVNISTNLRRGCIWVLRNFISQVNFITKEAIVLVVETRHGDNMEMQGEA